MSLSSSTGWCTVALFLLAATIPLTHRAFRGRRAAPDTRLMQGHALVGLGTTFVALAHTMTILPAMGSPAAVAGGTIALAPGVLAVFMLCAHVGVGLQLRRRQLKDRARKRRTHVIIATGIAVAVLGHVLALRR
jgi:hypothetical protein